MQRKRILVTGGAGFIGSCLTRALLLQGHEVVVVDNLSTGSITQVPTGTHFIEGDIASEQIIESLPSGPYHVVCHLAAQSSGAVSMERPLYDFSTNAVSTVLLANWCLKNAIPRFIYASSMAVYGNPEQNPVDENALLNPISNYGASKLASEYILRVASRNGLKATALRMFNVYGPGQNMANLRQGMASIYLAYMLKNETIPITGSLDRFRDFVYIDDIIKCWLSMCAMNETPSFAYNLGSGESTTVRHLIETLQSACGLKSPYPILLKQAPPGDQFGLRSNSERAKKELNWQSTIPLEMGIKRFVEWAKTGT